MSRVFGLAAFAWILSLEAAGSNLVHESLSVRVKV